MAPDALTTLAERYATVQSDVAAAAAEAGRDPASITTIVVTKFHPAALVRELAAIGAHDLGENRHQEAAAKAAETVAPVQSSARAAFARVREQSEVLQRLAPEASALSMGMSGDFREAILEGATHLRIGSAITGNRQVPG